MSEAVTMSQADLVELEAAVAAALAGDDTSGLCVLGYGELSMALGWPVDEPRFVCKRTPSFTPQQFDDYRAAVLDYIAQLRSNGVVVVDTTIMSITTSGRVQGYLVQPLLDPESLGHNLLAASTPSPDHPYLVALAEVMGVVTPHLSIDAQVTNFAFDGTRLTLIDVGTPFLWNERGRLRFDLDPFVRMLPTPVRGLVAREMHKTVQRWRDPRGVAVDVAANLHREGMPEWIDPAIEAMNRRWEWPTPIAAAEARAFYDEDRRIWPLLKRLQRVERRWQQSVRRRPYDFFIHSTFDD